MRNQVFTGNTDTNTVVYHNLNPPIMTRYIRFRPLAWRDRISMRIELYGCPWPEGNVNIFATINFITVYLHQAKLTKE